MQDDERGSNNTNVNMETNKSDNIEQKKNFEKKRKIPVYIGYPIRITIYIILLIVSVVITLLTIKIYIYLIKKECDKISLSIN